jgi:hypothetical protein
MANASAHSTGRLAYLYKATCLSHDGRKETQGLVGIWRLRLHPLQYNGNDHPTSCRREKGKSRTWVIRRNFRRQHPFDQHLDSILIVVLATVPPGFLSGTRPRTIYLVSILYRKDIENDAVQYTTISLSLLDFVRLSDFHQQLQPATFRSAPRLHQFNPGQDRQAYSTASKNNFLHDQDFWLLICLLATTQTQKSIR